MYTPSLGPDLYVDVKANRFPHALISVHIVFPLGAVLVKIRI